MEFPIELKEKTREVVTTIIDGKETQVDALYRMLVDVRNYNLEECICSDVSCAECKFGKGRGCRLSDIFDVVDRMIKENTEEIIEDES